MITAPPTSRGSATSLGLAIVRYSTTPMVLLDSRLVVCAASISFCAAFSLDPETVTGIELFAIRKGEWNLDELRELLKPTLESGLAFTNHEMDFGKGTDLRHLIVNVHRLDYSDADETRLLLAVNDVTAIRLAELQNRELVEQKQVLLRELQHRVANSLQIIASVLIQSARKVQSEEARMHLNDAHHRVMSIALLQRQLAAADDGLVDLRPYITTLCGTIGQAMIADNERIKIVPTIAEAISSSDVSISLGLIVTELIINALKHAFPNYEQNGEVTVEYTTDGSSWLLTVSDNGVGRPMHSTPGLGTGIVEALSRQLQARVETRDAHPGTIVRITHSELPR